MRYLLAGLIAVTARELYIVLTTHEITMIAVYLVVIGVLLVFRKYAIDSTKESR